MRKLVAVAAMLFVATGAYADPFTTTMSMYVTPINQCPADFTQHTIDIYVNLDNEEWVAQELTAVASDCGTWFNYDPWGGQYDVDIPWKDYWGTYPCLEYDTWFQNVIGGKSGVGPAAFAERPDFTDPAVIKGVYGASVAWSRTPDGTKMTGTFLAARLSICVPDECLPLSLDPQPACGTINVFGNTVAKYSDGTGDSLPYNFTIYCVPEPAALALLGLGALALIRRR